MSIIGWKQIYTHTVTGAAETSITIPDLLGNTDLVYKLEARIVNGYNGVCIPALRINNDTGSNYGYQYLQGASTSPAAGRNVETGINLGWASALSNITMQSVLIHAKSGYVRTVLVESNDDIGGTTINDVLIRGASWNNTADEITSLVVLADQANGLGIGTEITLSARAVLDVSIAYTLDLSDTVASSDSKNESGTRYLLDTISNSDSLVKGTGIFNFDTISGSDSLVNAIGKFLNDTINESDLLAYIKSKNFFDTIDSSDNITRSMDRNFSDSVVLLETFFAGITVAFVSDHFHVDDSITRGMTRTENDSISSSDSIVTLRYAVKNLFDTISVLDSITRVMDRQHSESLTISDHLSKSLSRSLADLLSSIDSIYKLTGKNLLDSVSSSDSFSTSWIKAYVRRVLSQLLIHNYELVISQQTPVVFIQSEPVTIVINTLGDTLVFPTTEVLIPENKNRLKILDQPNLVNIGAPL